MKKMLALLLSCVMLISVVPGFAQESEKTESDSMRKEMLEIRREEHRREKASLSESAITLSGKISLPDGAVAKEDGQVSLYIYQTCADTFVDAGYGSSYYAAAKFEKGDAYATYSTELPAGSYAIEVYSNGHFENTVTGTQYYRGGSLVRDIAFAEVITLETDKTLDIELMKGDGTISGTITLTNPPSADGYLYVRAYTYPVNDDSDFRIPSRSRIPVSKGQKQVDYSISAPAGVTYVYVYDEYSANGYFSVYDGVTSESSSQRRYFDTSKSYTDVDYLYKNVPVTEDYGLKIEVTLDEAVEYYGYVDIDLYNADGDYLDYGYAELADGEKSATIYFNALEEAAYAMLYVDDGNSYVTYYYNEETGITGNEDNATFISADTEVLEIKFPKMYTVSGEIDRNGVLEDIPFSMEMWVMFDNDYFYSEAYFPLGDTAYYSIKIPEYLKGEYADVSVGIGDAVVYGEMTLNGNTTLDLTLDENMIASVPGRVMLTEPAPKGGVSVAIYDEYTYRIINYVYIPEGETEAEYNAKMPFNEEGIYYTGIDMYSDYPGYTGYISTELDINNPSDNIDEIEITKYVPVSGKVVVPENAVLNKGVSFYVRVEYADESSQYNNARVYGTVWDGETECEYTVLVPESSVIERAYCTVRSAGESQISKTETDCEEVAGKNVGTGIDGVDFRLIKGEIRLTIDSFGFVDGLLTAKITSECGPDYEVYPTLCYCEYDKDGRLVDVFTHTTSKLMDGGTGSFFHNEAVQNGNTFTLTIWSSVTGMEPLVEVAKSR